MWYLGYERSLIKYADKMMYISKENGKNQVTTYKEELNV